MAAIQDGFGRSCQAHDRSGETRFTASAPPSFSDEVLPSIVRPTRDAALSAAVDGIVTRILVKEGQKVQAGDVVATLDNRVALANLTVARAAAARTAALQRARSELRWARRYLDRLLEAKDAASQHSLDQAKSAVDRAAANLKLAEEERRQAIVQVELQSARLAQYEIRAPFAGTVVQVEAVVGESVQRSDSWIRVVDVEQLETDLFLPVAWFGNVKPGQTCQLMAEAPVSAVVPGTITAVQPLVDAATQTFRCHVVIDNPGCRLPAGFAVRMVPPPLASPHQTQAPATP